MRERSRSLVRGVKGLLGRRGIEDEGGSSLLELSLILPMLVLILVGAVDFGKAYYLAIEISSAAEAGALYGTQNTADTSGMQAAAVMDAADVPGLAAVATRGCECSDGSGVVANCSSTPTCNVNVVNFVQVNTSAGYTPIFRYPGLPASITLTGYSRMRAGH
jgi:Flp pilus assembly protein TadG